MAKDEMIPINEFDYVLPEDRIARYPNPDRSSSRLLVYKAGKISHHSFTDLPELLPENALLVFNNTKVIKARLRFKRASGAGIEVLLLNPVHKENAEQVLLQKQSSVWECMIGNKKKWKEEEELVLETEEHIQLKARWKNREKNEVIFSYPEATTLSEILEKTGHLPIPPYLNREAEKQDEQTYQTTYSKHEGSVAAPTAGLHFTPGVFSALEKKGIQKTYLTLHVGAGTFKPVSTENAAEHVMHEEFISVDKPTLVQLMEHEGPVIPVGTTSMRSLESIYWFGAGLLNNALTEFRIPQFFPYEYAGEPPAKKEALKKVLAWMEDHHLHTLEGSSAIYIVPGYSHKICRGIVTNFHQPKSTLLLLIASLAGNDWKKIYAEALENNYRFLSYGDSSLILK